MLLSIDELTQMYIAGCAVRNEAKIAARAREVLRCQARLQDAVATNAIAMALYIRQLDASIDNPEVPHAGSEQQAQAAAGVPDSDGVTHDVGVTLQECGCRSLQHEQGCRLHPSNKSATNQADGKST